MAKRRYRPIPVALRPAVHLAAQALCEDILLALTDQDYVESMTVEVLPPGHRLLIEADLPRWVVAFAVAGMKLSEDRPLPPACVAEELAMHAILDLAGGFFRDSTEVGLPAGGSEEEAGELVDRVIDDLFDDTDFLFLYDAAADGIAADPEEPVGKMLGMASLAYADWFRPFAGRTAHPFYGDAI